MSFRHGHHQAVFRQQRYVSWQRKRQRAGTHTPRRAMGAITPLLELCLQPPPQNAVAAFETTSSLAGPKAHMQAEQT